MNVFFRYFKPYLISLAAVMLLLFGDYLGIPNPLSYYMIELLPYVAKDIPGWERRMMNREMIMAEKAGQYGFDG